MSDLTKFAFAKIAQHKAPVFKEVKSGEFIMAGERNNFFDYLVDLFNGSPKHQSIINAKHRYVMGGGWSVAVSGTNLIEKANAQQVINKANPKETLQEVTDKCDIDLQIFGGFAMEIIRSKSGEKIAAIYHVDFGKVRVLVSGEDEYGNLIYKYCYLPKWPDGTLRYDKISKEEGFKEWDAFWDNPKAESSLYYHKPHRPLKNGELDAYPLPDYISACGYIECDKEIQNFHLNNIKNNFWGGQIVKMANVFSTEEERDDFVSEFESQKTGTDNTGSTFFIFTNSKDQEVTATPLSPSELDKQFDILNKSVRLEISIAHNLNLKLLGNELEGQAFSRTEYNDLYDLFYFTWVLPHQNEWAQIINYIYSFNGLSNSFKLQRLSLISPTDISKQSNQVLDALNTLSPLVANKVLESMSTEEIRSLIGLKGVMEESVSSFSKQSKSVLDQFKSIGEIIEPRRIVSFYKVELDESGKPTKTNEQFASHYFAEILGVDLTKVEAGIVSAIKKNPKITPDEIATAFKLKPNEVSDILSKLTEAKIVVGEIGKDAKISKKASTQIADEDVIVDVEVRYRYSDKGAPKLIGTSRPFCEELMALSKAGAMYTRDEIDSIKNDQDENTNAWVYRGGFYTNPNNDKTTPFCRHFWEAVVIRNK